MKIYQKAYKKYFTNAKPTIMKIIKFWNERVKIRHCQHEKKKGRRVLSQTISKALRFSGNYYQPKIAGVWEKKELRELSLYNNCFANDRWKLDPFCFKSEYPIIPFAWTFPGPDTSANKLFYSSLLHVKENNITFVFVNLFC